MKKSEPLGGIAAGRRGWNISKRTVDPLSLPLPDVRARRLQRPRHGKAGVTVAETAERYLEEHVTVR